jgi:hypothetical protein
MAVATGVALLSAAGVALAHHSSAMYDDSTRVTLRGAVTKFKWTNPHVTFWVTTDVAKGQKGALWVLEATSPGNLARAGWSRSAFTRDVRVEVVIAPLRDGTHGGWCRTVMFLDTGKKLDC